MPRSSRLTTAVACLVAGAPALLGAQLSSTRIDTTLAVGRDASVDLGLVNGDVTVTASNRGEIRIDAYSQYVPLRFDHVGSTVRIRTESGNHRRLGTQRIDVVVPVGTRVSASTVSGTVSVRGVRGEVEASSVTGSVVVEDAVRRATLSTVSGRLRGAGIDGDVRATGTSSTIDLSDVAGEISAETVSGSITMRDARSDRVRAQTVSGNVTYDGTVSRSGRYEFQTHSGNVRLLLPDGAGASLHAQTFSGRLDSALEVQLGPTRGQGRRGNELELTIGGGGARVEAQTFSGNITIDRAPGRRDLE